MSETVQTGGSQGQPPKEMSMEIRLLLAFLLMGAVMFLTPYLFKSTAPPPAPKQAETAQTTKTPAAPSPAAPSAVEAAQAPASISGPLLGPPATEQKPLPPLVIDTDLYKIVFSNHGANVRSWVVKKYKGNDNKPLELVNTATSVGYPFSVYVPNQEDATKTANWAYYTQSLDPDGLGVTYTFSNGKESVRKTFRFQKDSYLSQVTSELSIDGKPVQSMLVWRGGFGDLTVPSASASDRAVFYNVADNKLVEQRPNSKNPKVESSGNYSFAGLADQYFAGVFLPKDNLQTAQITFTDYAKTVLDKTPKPFAGVAVSDGQQNRFEVFVGPKDYNLFGRINPKLRELIDFGWFAFLAKPLFLITNWFDSAFIHSYGWSLVVVTIVLNMILFPIKLSNMKSMRKMQALKPQIDAINQKYKNISLRDPRKAEQNQEVMALYKKNGVNPMGGCFPMLLQLPFFYAFYKVCTVAAEMRGASWLWVSDLSQAEHFDIHFLPVIMIASQFLMQKMTPQPTGDSSQQKMMMMMPLIFGFMFWNLPSGLVLYYMTSNLVGVGQQWFFNHTAVADEAARSVEPPKKSKVRK